MGALGEVAGALTLAALLVGGGRLVRGLAVALSFATLAVPFIAHGTAPLLLFLAALVAAIGCARVLEMAREQPPRSARWRVVQALTIVDWRSARRVPSSLSLPRLVIALLHLVVAGGLIAVGIETRARAGTPMLLAGWLIGAVVVWAVAEGSTSLLTVALGVLGWAFPPLHDRPIASRSLGDLWGSRWNLTVARWLRGHVLLPLARRGHARAGLFAAFVLSASFHAYTTAAAAGAWATLSMTAFFLVQGLLVATEQRLGIARWPRAAARMWFFGVMLVTSPLFVEPMIQITMRSLPVPIH